MSFDFSKLRRQPVNFRQINDYLKKAAKTYQTAKKLIDGDADSAFKLAYDSLVTTTLALMLSKGYRTGSRKGHHKIMVKFAKSVLGVKFNTLTAIYNRMSTKRNKVYYEPISVVKTEAKNAVDAAEEYFKVVEDKIVQDNPQQKLWRP